MSTWNRTRTITLILVITAISLIMVIVGNMVNANSSDTSEFNLTAHIATSMVIFLLGSGSSILIYRYSRGRKRGLDEENGKFSDNAHNPHWILPNPKPKTNSNPLAHQLVSSAESQHTKQVPQNLPLGSSSENPHRVQWQPSRSEKKRKQYPRATVTRNDLEERRPPQSNSEERGTESQHWSTLVIASARPQSEFTRRIELFLSPPSPISSEVTTLTARQLQIRADVQCSREQVSELESIIASSCEVGNENQESLSEVYSQLTRLRGVVERLMELESSDWARGLADDPPPEYSSL